MPPPSFYSRVATGRTAEQLAAAVLQQLGWHIVGQNITFQGGELDLIAKDGDELVAVEVRYRATADAGTAAESLTPKKLGTVARSMQRWLLVQGMQQAAWRLDAITIDGETGTMQHWRGLEAPVEQA